MKFTFTREDINTIGLFVRNPGALPLKEYNVKEYSLPDQEAVKQYRRLKEWIESKLMTPRYDDAAQPKRVTSYEIPDQVEVSLKTVYLERLISIVKHYEPIGNVASFATTYWPLMWKLKGEKVSDDSVEEA